MLPPLNRTTCARADRGRARRNRRLEPQRADEALIELLQKLSALVCALPWVVELELAPVVTLHGKAMVVGARARSSTQRVRRPPAATATWRSIPIPPSSNPTRRWPTARCCARAPIRPEDATMEQEFVAALSEHTRYMRFMQHLPALTPQMLARFTQVDYDRELALLALDDASGERPYRRRRALRRQSRRRERRVRDRRRRCLAAPRRRARAARALDRKRQRARLCAHDRQRADPEFADARLHAPHGLRGASRSARLGPDAGDTRAGQRLGRKRACAGAVRAAAPRPRRRGSASDWHRRPRRSLR